MSMKGKGGKGGKAKGGGKNVSAGETVEIKRTKARATSSINEAILTLREALFDEKGRNRDPTAGIAPAFMKYDRKGLDCTIEFAPKLSKEEVTWAFGNVKECMEAVYDEAGYGWDDADKLEQLRAPEGRFLLVREAVPPEDKPAAPAPPASEAAEAEREAKDVSKAKMKKAARAAAAKAPPPPMGALVAIAHFRFSVQGEYVDEMAGEPSLVLWDLVVDSASRRKGLGKHLLVLLELVAIRARMRFLSLPVMNGDGATLAWVTRSGRGFAVDGSLEGLVGFDAQEEGFQVYCKELVAPTPAPAPSAAAAPVAPPAAAPASPAVAAPATTTTTTTAAAVDDKKEKEEDKAN